MSGRQIIVAEDADVLAHSAAERLIARVVTAAGAPAVCLTGGDSPQRLYELLAREPYRGRVPWERVHWFMGDDRFVPLAHELSNMGMARRAFLDRVGVAAENIHAIPIDAAGPGEAASRYEAELKRFYGRDHFEPGRPLFELVLMGLGSDGHTASLFPHAPALSEKERWVVGVEKAGLAPFVPRVTLTFPALAATHEMLFEVTGEDKRAILARVLAGEDLPAARAHADGDLVLLVDRAAAPAGAH